MRALGELPKALVASKLYKKISSHNFKMQSECPPIFVHTRLHASYDDKEGLIARQRRSGNELRGGSEIAGIWYISTRSIVTSRVQIAGIQRCSQFVEGGVVLEINIAVFRRGRFSIRVVVVVGLVGLDFNKGESTDKYAPRCFGRSRSA